MEAKPDNIDLDKVKESLENISGVVGVHDLHIWMITPEFASMTVHLSVTLDTDRDMILEKARHLISEQFSIEHTTIQMEGKHSCICENKCN